MTRPTESPYIEWAKLESMARYTLATSGVASLPRSALEVSLDDIELSGESFYGYAPLNSAIAGRFDVPEDCVVAATGTSMANHLAMAAMLQPGDEVVIEQPTYEPLLLTAGYLGARVRRVARRPDEGFRLDPDDVARVVTPATRLIVLANLHNPTSCYTADDELEAIGDVARAVGARVLVDEVYLDALFDRAPRSSVHKGPEFVATGSLTKVYGLSGLRCGWVLAEPALARRMWRLNDLFGNIPAHAAERLSVLAFEQRDRLLAQSRRRLERNRAILNAFLASRDDLDTPPLAHGTVAFPRFVRGRVEPLCRLLREKYDTTVVPGRYFEVPDRFRVGIGGDTAVLEEGLRRLGAALDDLRPRAAGTAA